jgi:hypothetical protein
VMTRTYSQTLDARLYHTSVGHAYSSGGCGPGRRGIIEGKAYTRTRLVSTSYMDSAQGGPTFCGLLSGSMSYARIGRPLYTPEEHSDTNLSIDNTLHRMKLGDSTSSIECIL